ncbi:calcium/proton exchanger [Clostridium bornimense]|uniref:Calcium/proton exchanger n=1 Tax=Clostridium bornimense TaxID=1216932 RepID=W6RTL0_9CLOT|nr:calcium/sodium antiporter [Clostridium bornimense]CDM67628.1 calcium/proton exchanger [Clostridium bornimense]
MSYIILIIGFILLIKGADLFVDGSSSIAKKIGIPPVIVGLTLVSLGTSAPELAVSVVSSIQGNNGITLGNVIGSNLFNSLVVLGVSAMIVPLVINKKDSKRDFAVNIFATILVVILALGCFILDGKVISRIDGVVLLICTLAYMLILIFQSKGKNSDEVEEFNNIKLPIKIILSIIGVAGIIVGGQLVVNSAKDIAATFGMSDKLIGLTIVAIGTSLPELVTSVVAIIKGEDDIALGNILGSNTFNLLLILGVAAAINPIEVSMSLFIDLAVLLVVTLLIGALVFINKKEEKTISRKEGFLLIMVYIVYTVYIIMRN